MSQNEATQTSEETKTPEVSAGQWLRLALEIGPLVAFFIANNRYGIMQRQSIVALADAVLAKQHRRVLKKGRGFAKLSLESRHEVRIAVKKLRYAVEFFASLYPGEQAKRYRKRLSSLQDALGAMNDSAVADTLLDQLVTANGNGTTALPLARAAGLVSGWYTRGRIDDDADLVSSWKSFRHAAPFWHEKTKQQ